MILDETGFTAGLNNAVKKLGEFDGGVQNTSKKSGRSLSNIWTSFVGNFVASGATKIISSGIAKITGSVDGAIKRFDTINNSGRVFENMGFGVKEVNRATDALKKSIDGLPTPLDSAYQGMTALAATYNDIEKGQQIFSALNNAILGFGGDTAMVDNAIMQLSQLPMDGPLDAQTWNSLRNSGLTPVLTAMAKDSKMSVSEMKTAFGEGELTVQDFTDHLIKMNKDGGGNLKSLEKIAKDSTSGIGTGISNMRTAITRGVTKVIESVNEILATNGTNIAEIIANTGASFEKGLTWLANNLPSIIDNIKGVYEALKPWEPLILGIVSAFTTFAVISKVVETVNNVKKAFDTWKKATEGVTIVQKILNSTLLSNPFVLIATAIVGVVAGLFYLWKTNENFRKAVIEIWDGIKQAFSDAAEWVVNAWESTKEFFTGLWDGLKDGADKAVQSVQGAWNGTKKFFSDTWTSIKDGAKGIWSDTVNGAKDGADKVQGAWESTKKWFSNTWNTISNFTKKVWDDITDVISERADKIYNVFEPIIATVKDVFSNVQKFLSNTWDNIATIASEAWTIIKNVILAPVLFVTSMITGGWDEAKENMIAVWNNISESASEIWGAITNIFVGYLEMIKGNFFAIWDGIKGTLTNVWTVISETAKDVWGAITEFFVNTWQSIKDGVSTAWEAIKQFFIDTWESLKQTTFDTWNAVKEFFPKLWADIQQGAKDAWNKFTSMITTTWDNIKSTTQDKWNGVKQFVVDTAHNLVNGAKEAWENLKNSVSETIDKVKEFFGNLKDINLFEIGQNIIEGLTNGVKDKLGALKDSIVGVAENIKGWVQDKLEIFSPSRWMKRMIGRNIPLGVVKGIEEEQPTLNKAVTDMTDLPVELPRVKVAGQSDTMQEVATANIQNSQQPQSDTQPVEVHVHLTNYGDLPETTAMRWGRKLMETMNDINKNDYAPQGGAF